MTRVVDKPYPGTRQFGALPDFLWGLGLCSVVSGSEPLGESGGSLQVVDKPGPQSPPCWTLRSFPEGGYIPLTLCPSLSNTGLVFLYQIKLPNR